MRYLLFIVGLLVFYQLSYSQTYLYDFTYADRSSLLADGWDFIAVTPSNGSRNTEQTSGAVVSYDQQAHPGVLRIPVDVGEYLGDRIQTIPETLYFGIYLPGGRVSG